MKLRALKGTPAPLGLSVAGSEVNFALFSAHATQVFLSLFLPESGHPEKEFPLEKTGDIWHIALHGLPSEFDYSFRCDGPHIPKQGLLFNPSFFLADPYARFLGAGQTKAKAILHPKSFDWQGDKPPKIPLQDLILYEMHVKAFTEHSSSGVSAPGTYLGIIEKIPHLKKLGVNAIELMPLFEFDETHCKNIHPKTGRHLTDYWGYNPLHFFTPMRKYASSQSSEAASQEFKQLVRELHKNGIEVILDVVYNHTGEEKDPKYYVNFRGLDNSTYYTLQSEGRYRDDSGCGNTLNCNNPPVQRFILDSLRYWVEEMHVDGFRFDLASILTRGPDGQPLAHPPLLKAIAEDPLIKQVKLIAEPWDAAGLYQVGAFPKWGPWSEWNDQYRDTVRRFIKGTDNQAGDFANVLCGSEKIYKTPLSSINFITAHDGFTLRDLVTYQEKHNYDNGEMNRDGSPQNYSWNCGAEGPTNDPQIIALREKQMR
ncbi:MAG TPA: isoamylase, partial [Chlamydiales bacterium]|nr:isoamylase [Chlamydiales bacterium]